MFKRSIPAKDLIDFDGVPEESLISGVANAEVIQKNPFVDLVTADEDTLNKLHKRKEMKFSKFLKENLTYLAIGVLMIAGFCYVFGTGKNCNPKESMMCKVDMHEAKITELYAGNMEYRYDYDKKLTYDDYCIRGSEQEEFAHNIISAWEINGTRRYFKKGDVHRPADKQKEAPKNDDPNIFIGTMNEWKQSIMKAVGYNKKTKLNLNQSVELDTICVFDLFHGEYRDWITKSSDRSKLVVKPAELKNGIIHTEIYGLSGTWDVSLEYIKNKMKLTIEEGGTNCVCAQENGFNKNIMALQLQSGITFLINPEITSRGLKSTTYTKPYGGILGLVANKKIMVPNEVEVGYVDEKGVLSNIHLEKESAVCALMCVNDQAFFT
jgi:hypothetical protein